jgi:hypothetical protein
MITIPSVPLLMRSPAAESCPLLFPTKAWKPVMAVVSLGTPSRTERERLRLPATSAKLARLPVTVPAADAWLPSEADVSMERLEVGPVAMLTGDCAKLTSLSWESGRLTERLKLVELRRTSVRLTVLMEAAEALAAVQRRAGSVWDAATTSPNSTWERLIPAALEPEAGPLSPAKAVRPEPPILRRLVLTVESSASLS